jgi:hypothetical protein
VGNKDTSFGLSAQASIAIGYHEYVKNKNFDSQTRTMAQTAQFDERMCFLGSR